MNLPHIILCNIPITTLSKKDVIKAFVNFCEGDEQISAATPNAEICLEAQKNPDLLKYLQKSELNLPDTVSLLWAATAQQQKWSNFRAILELLRLPWKKKYWNKAIPEQISGSDIFLDFCKAASENRKSIFLLGGQGQVAEKTKTVLQKKFPNLIIRGALSGSPKKTDEAWITNEIKKTKPDVLFVAYGCPAQELWISRNLKKCQSVKFAIGLGGTFDFIAGKKKRAPKILRKLGFEWLWRLSIEPSRINRIGNAVFKFPSTFLTKNR